MSTTNWVDALSSHELPADDVTGVVVAGSAQPGISDFTTE